MYANKGAIVMFTVFLLVSFIGVSSAEIGDVNGTYNISQSGNISANETNQSYQDQNSSNNSGKTNVTNNAVSSGGIKNFMKSFQFRSSV